MTVSVASGDHHPPPHRRDVHASEQMLAVHPLPVQPDTELVHVRGSPKSARLLVPVPVLPLGLLLPAVHEGA